MLTKEEQAWEYDPNNFGFIRSDRITNRNPEYVDYAGELLDLYANGAGKTRRELERGVEAILDDAKDGKLRRTKAFRKLLEDESVFDRDADRSSYRLRKKLYHAAAQYHPLRSGMGLWGTLEEDARNGVTAAMGMSWEEIVSGAFRDVTEFHTLKQFKGYESPKHLLNRYNIAQAQAMLLRAVSLRVEATQNFKRILRYAKLARLLHVITRISKAHYVFEFFGPASVLRQTTRYGGAMAKFLPSLLRIEDGWTLDAEIQFDSGSKMKFHLSPASGLVPHGQEEDPFDSKLEQAFYKKWGTEPRNGWALGHEDEVLWQGQKVFIPDFTMTHQSGRQVLFEIVGYWTPEYAKAKQDTLAAFPNKNIVLAVPDDKAHDYSGFGYPVLRYKSGIKISSLLKMLN